MKNEEIFERLIEHGERPVLPRPAHVRPNLQQLRAEIEAMPKAEVDRLVEFAEDAHHAHLLDRWTAERRERDVRDSLSVDIDPHKAVDQLVVDRQLEEAASDKVVRDWLGNRTTGTGPVATMTGDGETAREPYNTTGTASYGDENPTGTPLVRYVCSHLSESSCKGTTALGKARRPGLRRQKKRVWLQTPIYSALHIFRFLAFVITPMCMGAAVLTLQFSLYGVASWGDMWPTVAVTAGTTIAMCITWLSHPKVKASRRKITKDGLRVAQRRIREPATRRRPDR